MLLNSKGFTVNVNDKFNSKENPNMFVGLREVHAPLPPMGKMFQLGNRARIKNVNQDKEL
jgi:hypothetical protein